MITDKLLTFCDHKHIDGLELEDHTNEIDLGAIGNEIARTLNVVCQVDLPLPKDVASVKRFRADLIGYDGEGPLEGWDFIIQSAYVGIDEVRSGKRLINFVKLPLGMEKYSKLKIKVAAFTESDGVTTPAPEGMVYSAYLTPSAEQEA